MSGLQSRRNVFLSGLAASGFGCLFLLASCQNPFNDMKNIKASGWNPDLAVPLVNSYLSIDRLALPQSGNIGFAAADSTGLVTLVYEGNAYSLKAEDVLSLPDQHFNQAINVNGATAAAFNMLPNGDSIVVPFTAVFDVVPGGGTNATFDSMMMKSGSLNFSTSSNLNTQVKMQLQFTAAVKTGSALRCNATLPGNGSSSTSTALDGYKFDFTHNGTATNKFPVTGQLVLVKQNGSTLSSGQVTLDVQLTQTKFSYLYGHFGTFNVSLPTDTLNVKIFNSSQSGSFSFVNPKLRIAVVNSFGVTTRGTFTAFVGQSNNNTVQLNGLPTPWWINAPQPQIPLQPQTTTASLDNTNSNFASFFTSLTNKIIYKLDATFNPNGGSACNFVYDSSRLAVNVKAELPMWGCAQGVSMIDTLPFELPAYANDLERALIRVNIENGFPLEANVQVYFADTANNVIDSLVTGGAYTIASGQINANGKVDQSASSITDVSVDKGRWQNLYDRGAKKIIVKGTLSSYQNGGCNVRIYNTDGLRVRLGVQAVLNIHA